MINNRPFSMTTKALITTGLLFATMSSAIAEMSDNNSDWQMFGDVYLWGPDIKTKVRATGQDVDISLNDIIDNLDFVAMGGIGAKKDKLTLFSDFVYMDVEDSENGSFNVPIGPHGFTVGTKASVEIQTWVVQPMVGYTLYETPKMSIDLAAGARYLWVKVDSEIKTSGPLANRKYKISDSENVLDGVVGIRSTINLSDKWNADMYFDAGGGDSDNTWQGRVGLNYQFENFQGIVGYRYLKWNFDSNIILDDLEISGPYVGAKFAF